jgi:hypothetical protein
VTFWFFSPIIFSILIRDVNITFMWLPQWTSFGGSAVSHLVSHCQSCHISTSLTMQHSPWGTGSSLTVYTNMVNKHTRMLSHSNMPPGNHIMHIPYIEASEIFQTNSIKTFLTNFISSFFSILFLILKKIKVTLFSHHAICVSVCLCVCVLPYQIVNA